MSADFDALPVLGLGANLSLGARPDPARLVELPGGPSFIEYAGLADVEAVVEDIARIQDAGAPVLFHPSYINFCGSFENDPAWLAATERHLSIVGSPWFAQDCAYCFWEHGAGYSSQFGWFLPPMLNRASLDSAVDRVCEVQAAISVPVAVEPPPFPSWPGVWMCSRSSVSLPNGPIAHCSWTWGISFPTKWRPVVRSPTRSRRSRPSA